MSCAGATRGLRRDAHEFRSLVATGLIFDLTVLRDGSGESVDLMIERLGKSEPCRA
jgi:hypothetical protein